MEIFEGPWIHFAAMLLAMGVVYFALKLKVGLSGKMENALNYFFIAMVFLLFIHGLEIIGNEGISLIMIEHETTEVLEHLFFFLAMLFMMISLNKMAKAFGEETKSKEKEEE